MIVGICAAVLGATILTRILWLVGIGTYKRFTAGLRHTRARVWPWRYSAVIAWAGMRGVVTLAAAFVLPADTPQRAVLVLAAFVVVAGTLLIQGMTLPGLVRRLRLPPPDPAEDALQEAAVLNDMTRLALEKLDEIRQPPDDPTRSSPGCATGCGTGRTRRGSSWAGRARSRRRRARRTAGCAWSCWPSSGSRH